MLKANFPQIFMAFLSLSVVCVGAVYRILKLGITIYHKDVKQSWVCCFGREKTCSLKEHECKSESSPLLSSSLFHWAQLAGKWQHYWSLVRTLTVANLCVRKCPLSKWWSRSAIISFVLPLSNLIMHLLTLPYEGKEQNLQKHWINGNPSAWCRKVVIKEAGDSLGDSWWSKWNLIFNTVPASHRAHSDVALTV